MKHNIHLLLQKKVSWMLLILFFTFDGVVSYWGVKYMHGREADLLIAPFVEKYPLLYFPDIPLLIIITFFIYKIIVAIAVSILKKWKITDKNIIERIVLNSMVVYWAIGNSSGNLIFLLGFRLSDVWLKTTLVAIPITLIYVLYILLQIRNLREVK